jgi:hypothetical protein
MVKTAVVLHVIIINFLIICIINNYNINFKEHILYFMYMHIVPKVVCFYAYICIYYKGSTREQEKVEGTKREKQLFS